MEESPASADHRQADSEAEPAVICRGLRDPPASQTSTRGGSPCACLSAGRPARPRLQYLAVRIRRKVSVALRRGVVLMPQERLHVVERDAILHEPARGGVPHNARREPPNAGRPDRWIPDAVAEELVGYRTAPGRGEYQLRPVAAGRGRGTREGS